MKDIKIIIEAVNRFTGPIKQAVGDMQRIKDAAGGVSERFKVVMERSRALAKSLGVVGLVGGGAAALFTRRLVQTAAEFERFQSILETVEGSQQAASRSMEWVSSFAATTPFELAEVTESFVKLRSYGLNPMGGLLRTLGDTAAAMGKPLSQAVEAMADAVTGENERLKEFGIRARTVGKQVVYEYTANGKTLRKSAQLGNREMVQKTLSAIWNEKYAGAMDKQSKTWNGMMSNILDQWTRFQVLIMKSGVFEWLKDKLAKVLERIDALAASGELQKLAADIGQRLVAGLKAAWEIGKALFTVLQGLAAVIKWVADLVGGFNNLAMILAGIITAKLVIAIASLIMSLKVLAVALLANPVIAIATGIALAALAIYKYWGPIKGFFSDLWDGVTAKFKQALEWITAAIVRFNDTLPDWFKRYTPHGMILNAAATRLAPEQPTAPTLSPGAARAEVGGLVRIQVDSTGRARVREVQQDNKNVDFEVMAGAAMVAP